MLVLPQPIYSVSALNRETAALLEAHFLTVYVEGEISNLSQPASGHCYFTLKDAHAQVRCAMFRGQQRRHSFNPKNGVQVVVRAQVSLYEARGDYQLLVEYIEEAGDGALRRTFEQLKLKLAEEGLFAQVHKQPLPTLPQKIGVITSPSGAAIRDILTVLKRRFAAVPVLIYPVAVQGEYAKYEIARAIATANSQKACDVLILARGGGSLEDLWAFNEEMVARAIYASRIPIITGVGHETDVTIADFVADLRAATPTAAAEHATPDQQHWLQKLAELERRLEYYGLRQLRQQQQKLDWLSGRLQQQHPRQKLGRNRQRLAELTIRFEQSVKRTLSDERKHLETQVARFEQYSPLSAVQTHQQRHRTLHVRLAKALAFSVLQKQQRLISASQTLNAVSPLATINRGYALVTEPATGKVVKSTSQIKPGDRLLTRLADGQFTSQVEVVISNE